MLLNTKKVCFHMETSKKVVNMIKYRECHVFVTPECETEYFFELSQVVTAALSHCIVTLSQSFTICQILPQQILSQIL